MDDRVFEDREIAAFNAQLRADWGRHPALDTLPLAQARAIAETVRAPWAAGGPEMAAIRDQTVRLKTGDLPVRIYYPENTTEASPALIYLHGGGFVMFSINTHDRLMREYAAKGRFIVIGVDYPLAPEHKFPAALNRITDLVLWLEDNASALGIDPSGMAIGGDSAGGNLSIGACLRLRDISKSHLIKAVLSNYGGFSAECSDEAEAERGGADAVLNKGEVEYFWNQYLNNDAEKCNPYACPVYADLHNLPPVFLVIPDRDIVSDDSFTLAEKLNLAGVNATAKIYRGATHSFLEAMSASSLAREAICDGAGFIEKHLT